MRRFRLFALLAVSLLACPAQAQYPYGYSDYGIDPHALVNSWYQRFLGRAPDPGSRDWVRQLQAGSTPEAVLSGILGSQEYFDRSGGTSEGFVQRLFQDVTGRQPSPAQFNYWLRRLYTSDPQAVAYELLSRYPGTWQSGAAPSDYDYRRPYYRYGRYR